MTIYEVWDWDPMASIMGEHYIAARYTDEKIAAADAISRNADWRAYWVTRRGEDSAKAEPYNWQHARVHAVVVNE